MRVSDDIRRDAGALRPPARGGIRADGRDLTLKGLGWRSNWEEAAMLSHSKRAVSEAFKYRHPRKAEWIDAVIVMGLDGNGWVQWKTYSGERFRAEPKDIDAIKRWKPYQ